MNDDLSLFILARLSEDEQVADAALPWVQFFEQPWRLGRAGMSGLVHGHRTRAEVEGKRAILAATEHMPPAIARTVRLSLARPFSTHWDFRSEWVTA